MSYLLDTNVISELRRGSRMDPGVASWIAGVSPDDLYLSALVIGEIRKGIELKRLRDPRAALVLDRWLQQIIEDYEDRILEIDRVIAEVWGRLNVPNPRPTIDGLLAATASVYGLTLVTRNVKDVSATGVPCLNPFAS